MRKRARAREIIAKCSEELQVKRTKGELPSQRAHMTQILMQMKWRAHYSAHTLTQSEPSIATTANVIIVKLRAKGHSVKLSGWSTKWFQNSVLFLHNPPLWNKMDSKFARTTILSFNWNCPGWWNNWFQRSSYTHKWTVCYERPFIWSHEFMLLKFHSMKSSFWHFVLRFNP